MTDDGPQIAGAGEPGLSRRDLLRRGAAAVGGTAAFAAALRPLAALERGEIPTLGEFLQKHYLEMSPIELQAALDRIAERVRARYGVAAEVFDARPREGVEFVYGLDLSRCIGCRKCVHACVEENNLSRTPEIQYIRVLEMPRGTLDVARGDHHYDPPAVPDRDHYYLPIQCHQCADPPCVEVCPVHATWQEADGITVVDYDWCIGCRYCEAACPYWARRFTFVAPGIPADRLNPRMAYLSNRPRPRGVVEKCTFCLHRVRRGELPACLEVCPVGARKFGNVLDPESEVGALLRTKRIFVLKEEAGTLPRFFYYLDERYPREPLPPPPPHTPVADGAEAPEESREGQ
ncbi:MAG: 4Fe-4S dicluster domain-containing protein [Planctomycetota bacterium]